MVRHLRGEGSLRKWFGFYDLAPLPSAVGRNYPAALAATAARLRRLLGMAPAAVAVPKPVPCRADVLATPLLIHFACALGEADERNLSCPAALYAAMTDSYFKQEVEQGGEAAQLAGVRDQIQPRTALVKIALAILKQPGAAASLLLEPETPAVMVGTPSSDDLLEWALEKALDHGSSDELDPAGRLVIDKKLPQRGAKWPLPLSLLVDDGGRFGFVHDSFVHWFAAVGLRCIGTDVNLFRQPLPADGAWQRLTVRRLLADRDRWQPCLEFLGGLLTEAELALLVREMLLADKPPSGWPAMVEDLLRGMRQPTPLLEALLAALRHKAGQLRAVPAALRAEVTHFLRDAAGAAEGVAAWLTPLLMPGGAATVATLAAADGVAAALPEADRRRDYAGVSAGRLGRRRCRER